jgi:5'-3' exoribonuclease 2
MGVLPAASKTFILQPFHWLMTGSDSVILDFYPEDLNGKKLSWQGVVLPPFIEEDRLWINLNYRRKYNLSIET